MDKQIHNKIITIAKIEQNAKTVRLVDQDGDKYTLWIKLSDGSRNTQAYDQFKIADIMVGSTVEISFNSENKTFVNEQQKAIKYTERSVVGFREANYQNAEKTAPKREYQTTEPTESREDFGRRLAIHGMVNGMLASGMKPQDINITDLIRLEDKINEVLAGKAESFDEITVEDIPF